MRNPGCGGGRNQVAEAVVRNHRSNRGDATEEKWIRVFVADVEIDKATKEHEEVPDGGKNIGERFLSSSQKGVAFDGRR